MARIATIVRSRERAIFWEKALRDASRALVRAPDRELIFEATLEAILPFVKEAPGTRVSVWSGSSEKDHCVAAAGDRAEDIRGKETYISDFPDWLRVPLLEGETVDLKPGQPAEVREAFRFTTKVGAIFMVPLMVRGRFEGRIVVASDSQLPDDIRSVLETLGIQVSLALERSALDKELYWRRTDERFRKLVQNSSDIITVLETDGIVRYESPSVEQILGYKPEELIGQNVLDYVHPDDIESLMVAATRVIEEPGDRISVEYRFVHKNGSWCFLESVANNLLDDPDIGGVVINSRDVTGRKQDEEELRKSEGRNRAIIEAYPDLMFRVSRDGEYLDYQANDNAELYVPREEIIGNNIRDTLPSDVAAGALRHLARTFETGRMQIYEYQLAAPEGLLNFEARFVATGEDEALCVIRDVTERNRVQAALQESEERFRTLFEHSVDALIVHDEVGRIWDCNAEACRTLGYTREELLSLRVKDIATGLLSDEERRERGKQGGTLWQRVVRGDPDTFGTVHYGEHKRKDGTTFPIEVHVGAVDYGGRRLILGSVRDITERREFEKRLQENEQRYRSLFEYNPDAVYSLAPEGNFLTANTACETLTGYSVDELLRMSFVPLIVPEYLELTRQSFEKAARGEPQHYENAIIHKDGHRIELNVTKLPIIVDGEIVGVYGIAKDITERKRAEKTLAESEARFRTLFDQTAIGVCVADLDRRLIETNVAYQEITGYSGEELVGMPTLELTHPEDREGETVKGRSLARGEFDSYQREKRYVRKDGEVIWANATSTLVRDESGEPRFIMGVVEDVTDRRRADEELREAEERYRTLVDLSPEAIAVHSEGEIVYANSAGVELFGATDLEELKGRRALDFVHLDYRESVQARIKRSLTAGEQAPPVEEKYIRLDGSVIDVEAMGAPIHYLGKPAMQVVLRDITERKRTEEAIRESEERYRAVVERATDGIYIYDFCTKRLLESNTALQNMLGYTHEELMGMTIYEVIAHDRESIDRNTPRIEEEKSVFLGERRYRRKDGSLMDMESSVTLIPYGGVEAACCIVRDVTERKALEEQLSHQAFHDSLTGLPNRLLFRERLDHALARARRQGNRVAVLFMDLDNFKDVNDSLGHDAGDQLLISVAELLRKSIRPGDTVARFGGDEFTVLLEEVTDAGESTQVAERIQEALRRPLVIGGHEIFATVSIGIKVSNSPQDGPEKLLSHADLAMYRAKTKGKSRHEGFIPGMETRALERMQLDNDLRRAVEQDGLKVYYQPKVQLGRNPRGQARSPESHLLAGTPEIMNEYPVVGMEALVRWDHPERGIVRPYEFISAAEETGLIIPIGRRVLVEACRQARSWQERYPARSPLVMCVNLSARQFQHPDLVKDIGQVLRETGLEPESLQLEVTESAVMEEAESTMNVLRKLRNLGVGLAIDDFGTGYSSLSYLKSFPMDSLKIDQSFVQDIEEDSDKVAIVSGIITLAHKLGMEVIAEGVETAGQAEYLRWMGCDLAQGDYFSEPLPSKAAGELLAGCHGTRS